MKKKKVRNPLIKRISKELLGDWKKYFVVFLFLTLVIGFVSGMFVANESMMVAAEDGVELYKREDGHFELDGAADENLIAAIESGQKADVKQYYLDEAKKEFDAKFEEEFKKEYQSTYNASYDEAYQIAYDEAYKEAYDEAWKEIQAKVNDEYAQVEEKYELNDTDFQQVPVQVYENFYRDEEEDYDSDGEVDGTIRLYKQTEDVNLACLLEGRFPENKNEITIDRMHANNVGVEVGDTITVSGQSYEVVGLLAYVNYATLYEKATDFMFDALKFDVAMVTEEGFERLSKAVHYTYAWRYEEKPSDDIEAASLSEDFLSALLTQVATNDNEIEDYVPAYLNPAINFATDDMGSDESMASVLLNIFIVIIAFIFAVTCNNTIVKESSTVGTLRASGYTKGELIRHYLSMPVIVTLLAACVGNILGYALFKNVVVAMYYNSYSLPTYETVWVMDAFIKTTCVPVLLMIVINLIVIARMMQHTPLQFLRHDLKKTKRKKTLRLPKWSFLNRFRLRVIFQNIPNYFILFAGVFFIMILLALVIGMPSTLDYYKENADDMMFAKYQYVLNDFEDEDGNIISTENETAEPFSMTSLLRKGKEKDEEISVYGIEDGSDYVQIQELNSLQANEVYISTTFQDKYNVDIGDEIILDEKYENQQYTFKVAGFYDKCSSIAVFMSLENYGEFFRLEDEEFSGYMSNTEITDIKEENIATVITKEDITKMCDQLDHSMGSFMTYFQVLCIILSAVLIYLLTKLIIEKNETAISMAKILGYNNKEISGLYMLTTTIMLLIFDAVSVVLGTLVMSKVWEAMLASYSGWFTFHIEPIGYVKMFLCVLIGYLFVMVIDFKRIKKIPMDRVLKNVE